MSFGEHYHKAVTKREAEKFWKVLPPEETKVVAFEPQRGGVKPAIKQLCSCQAFGCSRSKS